VCVAGVPWPNVLNQRHAGSSQGVYVGNEAQEIWLQHPPPADSSRPPTPSSNHYHPQFHQMPPPVPPIITPITTQYHPQHRPLAPQH
jgi:hypothetical protein